MSWPDDVLQQAAETDPQLAERRGRLLRHLDAAYNLARWLTRNDDDAQDVVQEAFLRAVRHLDQCRMEDPRTWLLQIVRNTCSTWRSRKPSSGGADELLASVPAAASSNPDQAVERRQQANDVRRAIELLPDEFREVVVLREIEGLSYKEVAGVVGVPIGTVMSRLSRARERLKELLAVYEGGVG